MQRAVRVGERDHRGGLVGRLGEVLAPGPGPVAVPQPDVVVLGALAQQLLDGLGSHVGSGRLGGEGPADVQRLLGGAAVQELEALGEVK